MTNCHHFPLKEMLSRDDLFITSKSIALTTTTTAAMASVFPDSPALRRIINHHTKEALIDIVHEWLSLYPITRVNDDLSEEDEDNYPDFRMDLDGEETRPRATRTMTSSQYHKYVAKQYDAMREKGQKKRVVDRMLAFEWNNGLDARQVAELDLRYYIQHANLKNWKAMKLEYGGEGRK